MIPWPSGPASLHCRSGAIRRGGPLGHRLGRDRRPPRGARGARGGRAQGLLPQIAQIACWEAVPGAAPWWPILYMAPQIGSGRLWDPPAPGTAQAASGRATG